MHILLILRILGILLMLFSLTQLSPLLVSFWYADGAHKGFIWAFLLTFSCGLFMWLPVYKKRGELRTRDGFLITALFWTVLGIFGSLPFILNSNTDLVISEAVFESVSGLTTTGATVMTHLDELPHSILFYRQQLQWFGGIGIIVIAVAILPMLGIGGMQLYRAETPGPVKDRKLTPRITETAKALFIVYVMLTLSCALAYWLAGMSAFDAICHAFSTVAIGGFSTHDDSIGYFDSTAIMMICSFYMLVAGINFALHFYAWRNRGISHYFRDSETSFYVRVLLFGCIVVCSFLYYHEHYGISDALLHGIFQTISIATTTGFTTEPFASWPSFIPFFLIMLSFMGGCAGSTGGGMKAVRIMLIMKQGIRELHQLIHPNAVMPLKVGRRRVEAKIISAVWSFFAVYVFAFISIMMALMMCGMDQTTAYSSVVATLNNLGPGLGDTAANFSSTSEPEQWILSFSMLLGRLEVFTLLVLLTPAFWRQ
ncbi:TrkH family potassium uptake protein [Dasania marina]|uniref:TrkH family potassium uptake protein n=1 Tax=Dasania marina TaxID=471499 RepID=UPI0030DC6B3B|tara:strand:+ start:6993 stop:8441 length:1449 start_codon:yes stop_codon:yes gene_type:complete